MFKVLDVLTLILVLALVPVAVIAFSVPSSPPAMASCGTAQSSQLRWRSGAATLALAKALRDAGVSPYVLDIRGHGGSGAAATLTISGRSMTISPTRNEPRLGKESNPTRWHSALCPATRGVRSGNRRNRWACV